MDRQIPLHRIFRGVAFEETSISTGAVTFLPPPERLKSGDADRAYGSLACQDFPDWDTLSQDVCGIPFPSGDFIPHEQHSGFSQILELRRAHIIQTADLIPSYNHGVPSYHSWIQDHGVGQDSTVSFQLAALMQAGAALGVLGTVSASCSASAATAARRTSVILLQQ